MNVTFKFAGQDVEASWNEKTYANGARYVSVTRGYQSSRGIYDANERIWKKRVGSPAYDAAIEAAFGWNKPQEERGEDGLTSSERAELIQFYADRERSADEAHARLLQNHEFEQKKPVYFVEKSYAESPVYFSGSGGRATPSTGIIYTVKTKMPDGSTYAVAGRHSYPTKQSAYRRCRQLNI